MASIKSWHSIFTLIFFIIANIIIIFPFPIRIPLPRFLSFLHNGKNTSEDVSHNGVHTSKQKPYCKIKINFATAPVLIVLLLLATTAINPIVVKQGIVGSNGVEPLNVMALFISLAYLSVSLDKTGLFGLLAVWVANKSNESGRRLYLLMFLFFFACAVLFGNDPVILSGTPFLVNFTTYSGIIPTAWIFSQFISANTASAILPPSNPTNLVITSAFDISFLSFAAHTVIPTILVATACYIVLRYFWFRSTDAIPRILKKDGRQAGAGAPVEEATGDASDPRSTIHTSPAPQRNTTSELGKLTDKSGAIFGGILFIITLLVLLGTSVKHIAVWWVTVPAAVIMIARDLLHDLLYYKKNKAEAQNMSRSYQMEPIANRQETSHPSSQYPGPGKQIGFQVWKHKFRSTFPTFSKVFAGLPLAMLPFAFSMFILVQALTATGWIEVFSTWWAAYVRACGPSTSDRAVVGAIFGMLLISTLMCNFCGTNIGATIFLAQILKIWLENAEASGEAFQPKLRLGSIYALALGTNFGAYSLTFGASLAGLLWKNILKNNNIKSIQVRLREFAYNCLPFIVVAIAVSGVALFVQVKVVPK